MKLFLTIYLTALVFIPSFAKACLMVTPIVTKKDVIYAPEDMLGIKADILSVTPKGPLNIYPHQGMSVQMKIIEKYQGEISKDTITIDYGPCHSSPGKIGEIVYALAIKDSKWWKGWYAPQFWKRKTEKVTTDFDQ